MDDPVHVMTREKAEKYRADFLRATRQWSGETAKVFPDDAALQRHLAEVKHAQDNGAPF